MIRIGIGVIFSNRKFRFKGSINVYDYRFISFFFFIKLFRDRNLRWRNFFDSFVGFEVRFKDSFIFFFLELSCNRGSIHFSSTPSEANSNCYRSALERNFFRPFTLVWKFRFKDRAWIHFRCSMDLWYSSG